MTGDNWKNVEVNSSLKGRRYSPVYAPDVGEFCLFSGPNMDDENGYTWTVVEILWMDDVHVLSGRRGYWPSLDRLEHVLFKPLADPVVENVAASPEAPMKVGDVHLLARRTGVVFREDQEESVVLWVRAPFVLTRSAGGGNPVLDKIEDLKIVTRKPTPVPVTYRTGAAAKAHVLRQLPNVEASFRKTPEGDFLPVALLRADQSWLVSRLEERGVVCEVAEFGPRVVSEAMDEAGAKVIRERVSDCGPGFALRLAREVYEAMESAR